MVMGELALETEVLVIGTGPGGYSAAFRAADLGLDVTLVDPAHRPGGVCLFRGCIPSKTLLYLAEIIFDAERSSRMGIRFEKPQIDLEGIRKWKDKVINQLAEGLVNLAEKRGIQLIKGHAVFEGSNSVRLQDSEVGRIKFRNAIIATGSQPIHFPGITPRKGSRIMDSTAALELLEIPNTLLVLGGGYVGLEIGTVYAALGSKVTVVELSDRLLPGADRDLVKPLRRRLDDIFEAIHLNTMVIEMKESKTGVAVRLKGDVERTERTFDRVLVGIGRRPNTSALGLEATNIKVDEKGFVLLVDNQQHTTDGKIFAVGDVAGGIMLAHKAAREGKVAAEIIAGKPSAFDVRAIPAVVYTDPQIAWCGLTEEEARLSNRKISVQRFPWQASGRATTMGARDGLTKIIADPQTHRVLGMGIVGRETEGLIAEGVLAIEMGALIEDLALTVHAHPTLSETEMETAEIFLGSATHILPRKTK
ncbi:MAG: dihydrolipoyl dehydrogenase [Deltaproteobacteria bacterium]|nr:dihydrolipoyl dehydrogenase [Deltaproteobacteria bacterium]